MVGPVRSVFDDSTEHSITYRPFFLVNFQGIDHNQSRSPRDIMPFVSEFGI